MKVFKIWIDAPQAGDFASAIVIAKDAREAVETHPNGTIADENGFFFSDKHHMNHYAWCRDSRNVNVKCLGVSVRYTDRQVIGFTMHEA